jgi:hypothetical protein
VIYGFSAENPATQARVKHYAAFYYRRVNFRENNLVSFCSLFGNVCWTSNLYALVWQATIPTLSRFYDAYFIVCMVSVGLFNRKAML